MIALFPKPGRPVFRDWSNAKIVGDGNSMMYGTGLASPFGQNVLAQAVSVSPLSSAVYANVAIGGQTARQMNGLDGGSSADIDSQFDASKSLNVLVVREGTNSMSSAGGSLSGERAATDLADYCKARLAIHPWKIIVLATPPIARSYWDATTQNDYNARIDAFTAWWRSHYGDAGVSRFVDTRRPGGLFGPEKFPDYTTARFAALGGIWEIQDPVIYVHLNAAGYALEAAEIRAALLALKK